MQRTILAASVALFLVACGGGSDDAGTPPAMQAAPKAQADSAPVLVAGDAQGNSTFKALAGTADGGDTISWLYEGQAAPVIYLRHTDAQGTAGPAVALQGTIDGAAGASARAWSTASIAVMPDGGAVMLYTVDRDVVEPSGAIRTASGVYLRRFDAQGRMVVSETPLATRTFSPGKLSPRYELLKVLLLADGSYVASWVDGAPSGTEGRVGIVMVQRVSSQNAPVGQPQSVGHTDGTLSQPNPTATLTADAQGGFSVAISTKGTSTGNQLLVGLWHVNAAMQVAQVVAPRNAPGLLVAVQGGNYLLFASDTAGAYRQAVDAQGQPVGERRSLASMPYTAAQRADGTIVAAFAAEGGTTLQQFGPQGDALGSAMAVDTRGSKAGIAPVGAAQVLAGWNRTGDQSTQAVYMQRVAAAAAGCPAGAAWNSASMYTSGNVVSYQGADYVARGVNFTGIVPTNQAYWTAQPCSAPAPTPTPTPTPTPSCADAPAWNSQAMYTAGNRVSHDGRTYTARGVNFTGIAPTDAAYWTADSCAAPAPAPAPGTPACASLAAWSAQATYTSGNTVGYSGTAYTARGVNFTNIPPTDQAYWSPSSCTN